MGGCATLKKKIEDLVVDKNVQKQEIDNLTKKHEIELKKREEEISRAKDQVIASKELLIKEAGNNFYAADATFKTIKAPIRTDLIINNFVNEGWSVLGRPTPDYNTLIKINERIKNELDEKRTSLEQLQANHKKALDENQKLLDDANSKKAALEKAEAEKKDLTNTYNKNLLEKQNELIATQQKIEELVNLRYEDAEALRNMKLKFSMILGALALISIAGAVYSPVFKIQLATFGALCGLVSYGIWMIQPWNIGLAASILVVGLVIWALIKYRKEERVADALVLATQDIKENASDIWQDKVKPLIEERLKKYKTNSDGKIVAVKDPSIEQYIDKKLSEWDAK